MGCRCKKHQWARGIKEKGMLTMCVSNPDLKTKDGGHCN